MTIPHDPTEFIELCKSLSRDELQDMINQLTLALTNIQVQLEDHVYHKYTTGPNGQPDWEHKARLALRYATWRLQTAQRIQSTKHNGAFEKTFVEVAKALLPPNTYSMLVAETKAIAG